MGHNHSGRTGHGVKHLVTILPSWYRNAYSGILFFDSKTVRKLMQCEMTELFVAQVTSRELDKDKDKDKEALFNVAYNVTDNISS